MLRCIGCPGTASPEKKQYVYNNLNLTYLTSSCAKKAQFRHERVEYNVFLFDEPLKGSKSLKIFKISVTYLSKSVHTGENFQILTMSNKFFLKSI
jgi:hypothetical protein